MNADDLMAVAITTGGVRVIHVSGVAVCPSELWRVDFVPAGPTLPGSTRPGRLTLGVRGTPPRRRGRTRSAKVAFEAIIEDSHASEIVAQIGAMRFDGKQVAYAEEPVHILYTDYSRAKGQSLWNAVNILAELIWR